MREGTASSTARLIARSILLASRDPDLRLLVAEGEIEILDHILGRTDGDRFYRMVLAIIPRQVLLGVERALLPGIITHYLVRKRMIERVVTESLAVGTKRVIVLGAGYDSLCLRLRTRFPETEFIEIDHPATQRAKAMAFPESDNFRYAPHDLADGIPTALSASPKAVVVSKV